MSFDRSIFWSAFADAGMLEEATYTSKDGAVVPGVWVGFLQPDALIMGDMVQTSDYEVEYETASLPDVNKGDRFLIDHVVYVVRSNPMKARGGYFSKVTLSKP